MIHTMITQGLTGQKMETFQGLNSETDIIAFRGRRGKEKPGKEMEKEKPGQEKNQVTVMS